MKRIKFDRTVVLGILSGILLLSFFIQNKVLFAVSITIWAISAIYNVFSIIHRQRVSFLGFCELSEAKASKLLKEKKYFKAFTQIIVCPLILIGLFAVVAAIFFIWYIAL